MSSRQMALRFLLTAMVITIPLLLSGCGVTSWQRMADAHQALHSKDMEAAISAAREK